MIRFLLTLTFTLMLTLSSNAKEPKRFALLIGIGDYPEDSGWSNISSQNDLKYIKQSLITLGFEEKNISTLLNSKATKKEIIENFRSELLDKVKSGDICYFHFSGHGQQIVDDNGDEIDGLDEAIVPYDSKLNFEKGINQGENLLIDDELNALFDELRQKLGENGHLLSLFDSCHSGTVSRGLGKMRGTDIIMGPQNKNKVNIVDELFIEDTYLNGRASMACLYASSANQLNYETTDFNDKGVGSLSYAFYKVVNKLKPLTSYFDFFKEVKLQMSFIAPMQRPILEGGDGSMFLSGEYMNGTSEIQIVDFIQKGKFKYGPGDSCILNLGLMSNLFAGTTIEFRDDSKNSDNIVIGEVVKSEINSSIFIIDSGNMSKISLIRSSGQIIKQAYPSKIIVNLKGLKDSLRTRQVMAIESFDYIKEGMEQADYYLSEIKDSVFFQNRYGDLLTSFGIDKNFSVVMKTCDYFKNLMMAKVLKNYESSNPDLNIDLSITDSNLKMLNSDSLAIGTLVNLTLSNTGKKGVYFSLIDINPKNEITVLFPNETLSATTAEDCFIPKSEVYEIDDIVISPPTGNQYLVLISSSLPINLNYNKEARDFSGDLFELSSSMDQERGFTVRMSKKNLNINKYRFNITQ